MDIVSGQCFSTCMSHGAETLRVPAPVTHGSEYAAAPVAFWCHVVMLQEEQEAHQACKALAISWTQLSQCEHATAQGWCMVVQLPS